MEVNDYVILEPGGKRWICKVLIVERSPFSTPKVTLKPIYPKSSADLISMKINNKNLKLLEKSKSKLIQHLFEQ